MDGIVGIFGPGDPELVNKTFLATGACQHRGKASTGLAIATPKGIYIHKGLGRIAEERIRKVAGDGSFQALDASYPIEWNFWPDWLKQEYERYSLYRK